MKVSLVTIVQKRTRQLMNLIAHLESCAPLPDELIIVWMRAPSELSLLTSSKFNIHHKFVSQEKLPIAAARNKGLRSATGSITGYLSVDTLPAPNFIHVHCSVLKPGTLVVSDVYSAVSESELYQPYDQLKAHFFKPSAGESRGNHMRIGDCASLFFIYHSDLEKIGGFDETFDGFGINDEDFFACCKSKGIELIAANSLTFHQQRANYACPFNHLLDFALNAQLFYHKWGTYPSKPVLDAYANAGCINKNYIEEGIEVLRLPTSAEIALAEEAAKHPARCAAWMENYR